MSGTVQASNGTQLPIEDCEQVFAYSGTFLETITVVYQGITYVQSFTNNGTSITSISGWVAQ